MTFPVTIEDKHLQILKSILQPYDYSFFVFGSRITKKVKKFSDIDLLYFEDIPNNILLKLEEDLEESDLPTKVDLVNYDGCEDPFKEAMGNHYVCLQASSKLDCIEQNHLKHFEEMPRRLGFDVYKKEGLHLIKCGLGSSLFNIVYGAPSFYDSKDLLIGKIKEDFKGQPFAWWVPPSLRNPPFSQALFEAGFELETKEHAMICDLARAPQLTQKTNLSVKMVLKEQELEDFIKILASYDTSVRSFYKKIKNKNLESSEKLFVGYIQKQPVIIATLHEEAHASGIFNLLTCQEERGKGYGTDMMRHLLGVAKARGVPSVTLSASGDSGYRLYKKLGFCKIGEFECFDYKGF